HLRFLSSWQTEARREFANLGLRKSHLFERSPNLELCGGLGARTKVADIARVLPIGNDRRALLAREGRKLRKKLVLAEVTAIVRVGEIGGVRELFCLHDSQGNLELMRD